MLGPASLSAAAGTALGLCVFGRAGFEEVGPFGITREAGASSARGESNEPAQGCSKNNLLFTPGWVLRGGPSTVYR